MPSGRGKGGQSRNTISSQNIGYDFLEGKRPYYTTHGDPVLKNSCQRDIPEKVSESNKWKQGESDEKLWNKRINMCDCYDFKKLAILRK